MFLCDVVLIIEFNKQDRNVRGYYRKGKDGKILYVRQHKKKFLIDFAPDVRELPTVEEYQNHLKKVQNQYKLSDDGIDRMINMYAERKPGDRLRLAKSAKYPFQQSGYTPDLRMTGDVSTESMRLLPNEDDMLLLKYAANNNDIEKIIKPDDTIFVTHQSTQDWYDNFLDYGIDTRSKPKDTRLGRLGIDEGGILNQSKIREPGLYVSTTSGARSGLILQVKAKDIDLSLEAKGLGYKTGLNGLYGAQDAVIKNKIITPEQIVGIIDDNKRYIPNNINPHSKDISKIGNIFKYTKR